MDQVNAASERHTEAERVNGSYKDEFLFVLPDDLTQVRLLTYASTASDACTSA